MQTTENLTPSVKRQMARKIIEKNDPEVSQKLLNWYLDLMTEEEADNLINNPGDLKGSATIRLHIVQRALEKEKS